MVGIFISYRRGEAEGQARALNAELETFYGRGSVFIDVDSIGPGRDFRIALLESIESCDAFLALIGPGWLDAKDAEGRRRLDDPKDFVREEIAVALTRDIPVVPILLQNVSMPRAENLPDDLKELAFRNAFELRHSRWHADVRDLVERLGSVSPALAFPQLSAASGQSEEAGRIRRPRWLSRRTAVGAVAALELWPSARPWSHPQSSDGRQRRRNRACAQSPSTSPRSTRRAAISPCRRGPHRSSLSRFLRTSA